MADNDEYYCDNSSSKTALVFRPYTVDRGGKLVVIRDVPMHECDNCGEVYLTAAVMKQLDELIAQLLAGDKDENIVRYPAAA